MRRRFAQGFLGLVVVLLLQGACALAQPFNNTWQEYFSYTAGKGVAQRGDYIFCYTSHTVTVYNQATGEVRRLSSLNSLLHSNILGLCPREGGESLLIPHRDGYIDILEKDEPTRSLDDMADAVRSGTLEPIRAFALSQDAVWGISTNRVYRFSPDMSSAPEGYTIWPEGYAKSLEIHDLCVYLNAVFIATSEGVYTPNLPLNTRAFARLNAPEGNYRFLVSLDEGLVAVRYTGGQSLFYLYREGIWTQFASLGEKLVDLKATQSGVVATTRATVSRVRLTGQVDLLYSISERYAQTGSIAGAVEGRESCLYLSTGRMGLACYRNGALEQVSPASPAFEGVYSLAHTREGPIFTAGGLTLEEVGEGNPYGVYYSMSQTEGVSLADSKARDALSVVRIPNTENEYLVGSASGTLVHYRGSTPVTVYDRDNPPLAGYAWENASITDIAIDAEGGWWLFAHGMPKQLFYRNPQGQWAAYRFPLHTGGQRVLLSFSPSGTLWLSNLPASYIAAIRPREFIASDGESGVQMQVAYINTGRYALNLTHLCFAKDGSLWASNARALVWLANPDQIFEGRKLSFAPVVVRIPEYPTYKNRYFLRDTEMTDLLFDDGENLWIGTQYAGLLHFDAGRRILLHHYTMANSPLPSNAVSALSYDSATGRLYIGTPAGLVSVITDSKEASANFENVKVYPNPVRPGYEGNVTVDGLVERSVVKITTVAGDLVRELVSSGGRVLWDLRNGHGQRVATGVYLLFCSDEEGSETRVVKLAVVR